jgi:hypothetical protein
MEIIVRVALNDWTPSIEQYILSYARLNDTSNVNYTLSVNSTGAIILYRPSTTGARTFTSSANNSFIDGETKWIKVTFDQNNGSSQSEVRFYSASDSTSIPTSWTQLGTEVTSADVGTGRSSDQSFYLGSGFVSNLGDVGMNGILKRTIVKDAIDGTTTLDADFDAQPYGTTQFFESSTNANPISIITLASWEGSWSLPAGATFVKVICVGGGAGGSSGRKGALLSTRGGGAGGTAGGVSFAEFDASAFTSSVTVRVGLGGNGGISQTTNSTNGLQGGAGNATTFGAFCGAGGGPVVGVGSAATVATANTQSLGLYSLAGGAGTANSNATKGPSTILVASGGGGSGFSNTNVQFPAGFGSSGLIVMSDVPAFRNFLSGSGGNPSSTGNAANGGNGQNGCGGGGGGAAIDSVGNSGAGGNGGAGFVVVVSYKDVDVQEFTADGTWNKPTGDYSLAKIFVVGGGGAGGSGRRGAASTTRTAGGAGGGGSVTCITIPFAQLSASEIVTVGLGGTGGAAVTVDSTDGNPGTSGGQSSFGTVAVADGGLNGGAGSTVAGAGGLISQGFSFSGGNGPASQAAGGAGTAGAGVNSYTGGGGSGGGISSSNNMAGAGAGGVGAAYTSAITAAQQGAAFGDSGTNATQVTTVAGFYAGNGGAGGLPFNAGNAGAGGNGAPKGGGGGGGGAVLNAYNSGAGGAGGNGYVCVVCI